MPTIEIFDKSDGILSFDLAEILAVIEPFGAALEWYFVEFEPVELVGANRGESPPLWVVDLFFTISNSPAGSKIQWQILKEFGRYIKQTIDVTLIAVRPGGHPPTLPVEVDNLEYAIVVQGIDTTLWVVTSRNQEVINRLKDGFKEIKIIAP